MEEELAKYKAQSLQLCERILAELKRNQDDADLFFGGEIHKAYVSATDKAINEARTLRNKIRNT